MKQEQPAHEIREIAFNSDDYRKELFLRDRVLREPLGLSLFDEYLENEILDIHLGYFVNNELVGTLILTRLNDTEYKMRQVAVEPNMQGKGIGKRLVEYAEEYVKGKGGTKIVLHARKYITPFYEKLGYVKTGKEFTEVTITHVKMYKNLPASVLSFSH